MPKITITVKPNSKKGDQILTNPDGTLTAYLRAKPTDNQANTALIKLLSTHYRIPKTQIQILTGATSRHKIISLP